ncbi:Putative ferric-chelate reductase 1 [Morus notabilis]|uniref:Putative ferric-chelate reductase 1 n=1 Tax=Morus notabilis TaxID=981085 RepID=W9QU52_9ROSA|nr:cytochrome b561 and DOMON domain-containing protein At3g07570 [Morus notabilis]EXB40467.1 Putative ferric-chelate reductase 1 [Morus notabilis]
MKTSFIIFMTISSLALSALVTSQTDSCSSNLNLNGLVSFDTTSLHCLAVWDAQVFILRYAQTTNASVWSFVLSAPGDVNSYVAIGFSSDGGMVGSSAVVGWISDGAGVIKQYYLGGTSSNRVEPDQGNLIFVQNSPSIVSQSNRQYLAFQLETSQPATRLLYSVGPSGFLPVAPEYRLVEHRNKVSTSINYFTGQSASQKKPHERLRKSHGLLNTLGWGILMVIGSIVARYCRQWDPLWFYVHMGIQSFGFLLGVIGVLCGFLLENRIDADVSTHKGLGIFILVLGCLQAMALLARPNTTSKIRKYWNWYHYGVGRTLLVFAIANVFYGIHLGDGGTGWTAGYAVVLCILFVTSAVLEYRMWVRN